MPFVGEVRAPEPAPFDVIAACSYAGALHFASVRSGMDDFEIADAMPMSHGNMSKVLKGTAGMWGSRLVRFMRITQSLAPLQWYADQMGCDLVPRDQRAARIKELEAELKAARATA